VLGRVHRFRSRGLLAGSGVAGADRKDVIGQRLKQPGLHWAINGADAIITQRRTQASMQREPIYSHHHNQTGAA
jgi:hypothetical protein